MGKIFDYFDKLSKKNMLTQAFIIGNTTYDEIKEELNKVLKSYFFKNCENMDENPDLYVLKQEDGIVSKDDIKNLLNKISTTSQFNSTKVYIIDKCEKLNDFAYNAILKTLEEPQENIYAILITTNMDSVKPTILSRCQKIFISSSIKDEIDEKYADISLEIIKQIEENNIKSIALNYKMYSMIEDRNQLQNVLKYILNKYHQSLENIVNNTIDKNDIITMNNDIVKISKKILIINNNINRLENNLNKNLSIDRFIIEMWRCNI